MIPESKLETTNLDIHPALMQLAERYSGELNIDFLFQGSEYFRVALNLVVEPTGEKRTVGIAPRSATITKSHGLVTSMISEAIREDIFRYMGELCYTVTRGRKIDAALLRFGLDDIEGERQGILQLENIAGDLRKVYRLAYTPNIYRNGVFWK